MLKSDPNGWFDSGDPCSTGSSDSDRGIFRRSIVSKLGANKLLQPVQSLVNNQAGWLETEQNRSIWNDPHGEMKMRPSGCWADRRRQIRRARYAPGTFSQNEHDGFLLLHLGPAGSVDLTGLVRTLARICCCLLGAGRLRVDGAGRRARPGSPALDRVETTGPAGLAQHRAMEALARQHGTDTAGNCPCRVQGHPSSDHLARYERDPRVSGHYAPGRCLELGKKQSLGNSGIKNGHCAPAPDRLPLASFFSSGLILLLA